MFDDSAPVSARAADRPLADTAAIACRGGWPLALDLPERLSLNPARRYVDAVLHRRDGRYALVEVKLGGDTLIEQGVRSLDTLSRLIDAKKMPKPSFRMIITAVGGFAYRRPDGIIVCPIGCLKP